MEDNSFRARPEREGSRRHRSRSTDSEEERSRRRRRERREDAGREAAYRSGGRGSRDDPRSADVRDRQSDRERVRRRSRSPAYESFRRQDDRDSRHQSQRDRSPDTREKYEDRHSRHSKRDRSPDTREKSGRSSREGSSGQVTRKSKGPLPSQAASFQAESDPTALVVAGDIPEKQKPNFKPTGLLAAASNSIAQADGTSIVLKYHEPPEARKPPSKDVWKLFVFKGADIVETIELSLRTCWLVGREISVVDMAAEHPSISKQHAVIQFRYVEKKNEFGDKLGRVKPYLMDLDSANGTTLNKDEVPPSRYVEIRDKDMIQFGHSTREYVLMLSPN